MKQQTRLVVAAELRRRAEALLKKQRRVKKPSIVVPKSDADAQRTLHELQVHQLELEMQNAELQTARNAAETALEKYTDLYDFAPVGYYSLDAEGWILEVNLTGAALLGIERSRLLGQPLQRFVVPASRTIFLAFLDKVFATKRKQICEVSIKDEGGVAFWVDLQASFGPSVKGEQRWCRVSASDISTLKRAEDAQRRLESLAAINLELNREILRREVTEANLKQSEQHQSRLLVESRHMQEQLRNLAHLVLQAQEEERKRISRELHDEISQTLVGINVHLETLARAAEANPTRIQPKIAHTQKIVVKAIERVHQFARELRPTALDDLGLIATLHSYMKEFLMRTGIRVQFTTFAGVEQLNSDQRTVLYRVAQSALNNVAQHAKASQVNVSILKLEDAVALQISDNGQAFEVERVLQAKRNKRLGLIGMRERVEMVGGIFTVESTPGTGTSIRAQIPCRNNRGGGRKKSRTQSTEATP